MDEQLEKVMQEIAAGRINLIKEIPGFPRYYANNQGEIYSLNYRRNKKETPNEYRRLRPGRQVKGYQIVCLKTDDGKRHMCRVHSLVCLAFHGDRPIGMQCSHLSDNKNDNRAENLRWETDCQNKKRKYENNGGDKGVLNSRSIFKKEDVKKIRYLLKNGWTQQKISKEMKCSTTSISRILRNKRYSEVL